ncbi:MAG: DUF881 domain-containing protein [Jatrophihabitantaceae bacterium]
MNPRDLGYEAAAARRGGQPARHWYDGPAVVLGAAVIGFVLVLAYVHTHRGAPEAATVHAGLVQRVRAAQSQDSALASSVQTLNAELNTVRDSALSSTAGLAAQLNRAELEAGQVAVKGAGLQVTLSDPKAAPPTADQGRVGTVPISASGALTDRDVRSVVNELWADGAEAISVNNIRLTPTSAIRFAGEAVLVDFQPITSPYTIRAIGNADDLATTFASSDVAGRYQTLSSADGIGFTFSEAKSMKLPANTSELPRFATVPTAPPTKGTK